jgi:hypothetical protein
MFTDEIPVVGEVVLIGTGLYLAGDFLYHHWAPFRNVCNDIGHATVAAGKWIGHETAAGAKWVGNTAVHVGQDIGHAAQAVGGTAKSVWHSVTSGIGSWF